jgi:NAD+ diphosphatase
MIQEIEPHVYDRAYKLLTAAPSDHALYYENGSVLLRREGDSWTVPNFSELPEEAMKDARHLFSVDGCNYFLVQGTKLDEENGLVLCTSFQLRSVHPIETAFAAVTGAQLERWYRCRSFCGCCGAAMEPSKTERAMVCPKCGLTEYPKICPAVIVAVRDGEKLLVTRYAGRSYKGYSLVAGFVEIGETLEDSARREVMEEVGLHIKNLRYYRSQPWGFTDTLLMGFYCDLDGDPTIKLDKSELCEGLWIDRKDLPAQENNISLTSEMIEQFRLSRDKL